MSGPDGQTRLRVFKGTAWLSMYQREISGGMLYVGWTGPGGGGDSLENWGMLSDFTRLGNENHSCHCVLGIGEGGGVGWLRQPVLRMDISSGFEC